MTSEEPTQAPDGAAVEPTADVLTATKPDVAGEDEDGFSIYQVALDVFEGPLDLLLHLVKRHELDILDIPIAFITEKYLEYLGFMRAMDLEIAGDYLVMAATLAFLKSRELLPPTPSDEEEESEEEEVEDPREALIRRLLEYERFRAAGLELNERPVSGRDVFARGSEIAVPDYDPGLAPVSLFRLAEAYTRVLNRAKINKSHEVTLEPITVSQRMTQLTLMLRDKPEIGFESLFLARTWQSEQELRTMLVVTLMSVLELCKLGIVNVLQPADTTEIKIFRRASTEEAMKVIRQLGSNVGFGEPMPTGNKPPKPSPSDEPLAEANVDAKVDASEGASQNAKPEQLSKNPEVVQDVQNPMHAQALPREGASTSPKNMQEQPLAGGEAVEASEETEG